MINNLLKRPRGRPSKTIEQQEIEALKEYTDDQIFDIARPPARGRLATEELIRRYEALKAAVGGDLDENSRPELKANVRAPEVCGCPYGQCNCNDGSENGNPQAHDVHSASADLRLRRSI